MRCINAINVLIFLVTILFEINGETFLFCANITDVNFKDEFEKSTFFEFIHFKYDYNRTTKVCSTKYGYSFVAIQYFDHTSWAKCLCLKSVQHIYKIKDNFCPEECRHSASFFPRNCNRNLESTIFHIFCTADETNCALSHQEKNTALDQAIQTQYYNEHFMFCFKTVSPLPISWNLHSDPYQNLETETFETLMLRKCLRTQEKNYALIDLNYKKIDSISLENQQFFLHCVGVDYIPCESNCTSVAIYTDAEECFSRNFIEFEYSYFVYCSEPFNGCDLKEAFFNLFPSSSISLPVLNEELTKSIEESFLFCAFAIYTATTSAWTVLYFYYLSNYRHRPYECYKRCKSKHYLYATMVFEQGYLKCQCLNTVDHLLQLEDKICPKECLKSSILDPSENCLSSTVRYIFCTDKDKNACSTSKKDKLNLVNAAKQYYQDEYFLFCTKAKISPIILNAMLVADQFTKYKFMNGTWANFCGNDEFQYFFLRVYSNGDNHGTFCLPDIPDNQDWKIYTDISQCMSSKNVDDKFYLFYCNRADNDCDFENLPFTSSSEGKKTFTVSPLVSNGNISFHRNLENINEIQELRRIESNLRKSKVHGNEIDKIVDMVDKTVANIDGSNFNTVSQAAKVAVSGLATLLSNEDPWMELDMSERVLKANSIITKIERHAFTSVKNSKNQLKMQKQDIFVLSEKISRSKTDLAFPPKNEAMENSRITLPSKWADYIGSEEVEYCGMSIDAKDVNLLLPPRISTPSKNEDKPNTVINSKLLSFSFSRSLTRFKKGDEVQITLKHETKTAHFRKRTKIYRRQHAGETVKAVVGSGKCVFWDNITMNWSTDGCKLVKSSTDKTLCECDHLTAFALLMDMHEFVGKHFGLEVLTLILCPLSIFCLFLALIASYMTKQRDDRGKTFINNNLFFCLLISNFLVIFVLDRHYLNLNETICSIFGIVTHYFCLCSIFWMLIQGIHIYKLVTIVFHGGSNQLRLFAGLAYGLPVLIIGLTIAIGVVLDQTPYGDIDVCWLNGEYIFAFMGPLWIVCTINFSILVITLQAAVKVRNSSRVKTIPLAKGSMSVCVVLGLTWSVGFLMLYPTSLGVFFAYVFTVSNASQGILIFYFHCWNNKAIRDSMQRKLGNNFPSLFTATTSSTAVPGSSRKKSTESHKRLAMHESEEKVDNNRGEKDGEPFLIKYKHIPDDRSDNENIK